MLDGVGRLGRIHQPRRNRCPGDMQRLPQPRPAGRHGPYCRQHQRRPAHPRYRIRLVAEGLRRIRLYLRHRGPTARRPGRQPAANRAPAGPTQSATDPQDSRADRRRRRKENSADRRGARRHLARIRRPGHPAAQDRRARNPLPGHRTRPRRDRTFRSHRAVRGSPGRGSCWLRLAGRIARTRLHAVHLDHRRTELRSRAPAAVDRLARQTQRLTLHRCAITGLEEERALPAPENDQERWTSSTRKYTPICSAPRRHSRSWMRLVSRACYSMNISERMGTGRPKPGYRLADGTFRPIGPNAESAALRHPERFAFLMRVDRRDPGIEGWGETLAAAPDFKALRTLVATPTEGALFEDGGYDRLLKAARADSLPLFVTCPGRMLLLAGYAERFPDVQFVIDHCGAAFDSLRGEATIDDAVGMARYPNVAYKWAHAQALLSTTAYPLPDLEPKLRRAVDAYDPERVMWAKI